MQTTHYTFTIRDLTTPWIVRKIDLRESLSNPYTLTLELLTSDLALDPARLLGADCRLTLAHDPGLSRDVHGLVLRVDTLDVDDHLRHFRLEVGPALALFAHQVDTRLWQHTSVPDIIKDVLEDSLTAHGRRLRLDLAASYPPRETCTQYRESDLAFVQRLLHEEGIAFTFDHDDDSEILVLVDDNARCPVVAQLPFIPRGAHVADAESVERLDPTRALGPTSLTQRDWNPLAAADSPFEANRLSQDDRGRHRLIYEHEDQHVDQNDAPVRARRKLEQRTLLAATATGLSTALALAPGRRFDLTGHPDPARDTRWQILHIDHHGEVPDADRLADHTTTAPTYLNTFTCIPDTTRLRPPHNPELRRPRVHGPHTALVVGPEGEEIHTDEHGRIRVRFHWDRTLRRGDDCSGWIRVAQTWAGPGWGATFIPRVGMEVVVQFLDGDPDRPLVVGCVPNSLNIPAVPLPDGKTTSALTSESTPGGGIANQISFEDARGQETLTLHSRRDIRSLAGHDHHAQVARNHHTTVGANQSIDVGANQSTTVTDNCNLLVTDGNLNTAVETGDRSTKIQGSDTTKVVTGDTIVETCSGAHTSTCYRILHLESKADIAELKAATRAKLTSANENIEINAFRDVDITARTGDMCLAGYKSLELGSNLGPIKLLANQDLTATSTNGGISIQSETKDIKIRAGGHTLIHGDAVTINATERITLGVGTNIITLTQEGIEIKGVRISSAADTDNVMTGIMIRLN